jgi:hypothetical protein
MTLDFLPSVFPAGDITDGQYLYRSLGSFWTQIFQDKNALKGYTTGMAEELIQSYLRLVETVNQYSVKNIDILHTEKWLPLTIKKSEFNRVPFVFAPSGAVFGQQPLTDELYSSQLFRFGRPKVGTSSHAYSFAPKIALREVGVMANRIISPSLTLLPGVDFRYEDGLLYFNADLFDNAYISKAKLLTAGGAVSTFQDADGRAVEDEFIVLWLYTAKIDEDALYKNFGMLFDLKLPTSEDYKTLLTAIMNLAVEGPTVAAIRSICSALLGAPLIIESSEIVEDVYVLAEWRYIITDKNTYRLPSLLELDRAVRINNKLHTGQPLSAGVSVVDLAMDSVWWQREISTGKVGFASHVFAAGPKNQLFFENKLRTVSYDGALLNFPVLGASSDVAIFNDYLNHPDRQKSLLEALHINSEGAATTTINPLDFVFNNFFKSNCLLLKLNFYTDQQLQRFFALLPSLQPYFPPHVYIITYVNLNLPADSLDNLNNGLTIPQAPGQLFSLDGSDILTGSRPTILSTTTGRDDDYYKDYINRVFCIAVGPYRNPVFPHLPSEVPSEQDKPLHYTDNLDELAANTSQGITCGLMRTYIPLSVTPPGQDYTRRPSTKEVPAILLIDF